MTTFTNKIKPTEKGIHCTENCPSYNLGICMMTGRTKQPIEQTKTEIDELTVHCGPAKNILAARGSAEMDAILKGEAKERHEENAPPETYQEYKLIEGLP